MRRQDSTSREGQNNMSNKLTKCVAKLSLNLEIRFGCIYARKKISHKGDPSYSLRASHFQVLECINDNAHKLDLPDKYNISATFNIIDLSHFDLDDNLRTNLFEEEGNDGGMTKE